MYTYCTSAKWLEQNDNIHKYMVLQCQELFYYKTSSGFLREDSQSYYSFGGIQYVGDPKFSVEKN